MTRLGPPEEIRWGEVPGAVAGSTDVVVRAEAVAVKRVDTHRRMEAGQRGRLVLRP